MSQCVVTDWNAVRLPKPAIFLQCRLLVGLPGTTKMHHKKDVGDERREVKLTVIKHLMTIFSC